MPSRHLSAWFRGGVIVALLGLCGPGCSGSASLNPVQGKVIHKNEALAGALVTLHPKGAKDIKTERPTGLTKEDGTFTIQTGSKDGAPAGEYTVTIICSKPVSKKASKQISFGETEESTDILNGMYADASNSKLSVTIKSGQNQLEPFDLK